VGVLLWILTGLALAAPAAAQDHLPAAGETGGPRIARLEVRLEEPGEYRTEVQVGEETFACAAPLREGDPCVLRDVPAGRARMILDSTSEEHRVDTPVILRPSTRDVVVEEGITLDGAVGYSFIGLGLAFAGPGTYLLVAATCDPGDRLCEATPAVGGTMAAIGGVLILTGLYMITFGNPYELYGADVRRDHRPAVSPEPEIEIGDPVGDPPVDSAVDEGVTLPGQSPPPPPSTNETQSEGDAEPAPAPPPATTPAPTPGPSAALGIAPGGFAFHLWF
jgi:hypothetical protein